MRPHPLYPELSVDADGTIWRKAKQVRLRRHPDGYLRFNHKQKTLLAHRVNCEAWHGLAPEGQPYTRHLDDNKDNICPSNLAWGTHRDNVADSIRNGTFKRAGFHKLRP